ncbi:ketopantoate reductase family protein [Stutzerimonas nitrititolerans]|uniref:ketopantoate reductase family protein n=1 Tax=Stutzerimonas nitrititolerans TaxID=2482751 RepID=UPI0028A24E0B|nr:2-dehydropantoate 2-reductase N-terminal domain-containing protein [Stutzerimonas nitrititolerans]
MSNECERVQGRKKRKNLENGVDYEITVIGVGAIGGFLASKLFAAGHDVSVIARGATLHAIREQGLRLHAGNDLLIAPLKATSEPTELKQNRFRRAWWWCQ